MAANASAADDEQTQCEFFLPGSRSVCRGASVPPGDSPPRGHKRRRESSASEEKGKKTAEKGAEVKPRRKGDGSTPGTFPTSSTTATETVTLSSRAQLIFLLEALSEELVDCPLFYSLKDVADYRGGGNRKRSSWSFSGEGRGRRRGGGRRVTPMPNVEAVRARLRSEGYECSGSHAEPRAIKTRAPLSAVETAVWSAVVRK
ncbi:unnamed protein product, partial [Laminaria digitata]